MQPRTSAATSLGARELAESRFGCDFPGRGGVHQHRIRFISNQTARLDRQPAITVQPPQEGMRIEEQTHVTLTARFLPAEADRKTRV